MERKVGNCEAAPDLMFSIDGCEMRKIIGHFIAVVLLCVVHHAEWHTVNMPASC